MQVERIEGLGDDVLAVLAVQRVTERSRTESPLGREPDGRQYVEGLQADPVLPGIEPGDWTAHVVQY